MADTMSRPSNSNSIFRITLGAILVLLSQCGKISPQGGTNLKDLQPFQTSLKCERVLTPFVEANLSLVTEEGEKVIGRFSSGHMAACELSKRASRNNQVCIEEKQTQDYKAIDIRTRIELKRFGKNLNNCLAFTRGDVSLSERPGYVSFMDQNELNSILRNLPQIADPAINSAIRNQNTMWYDESSMVYSYQDSFGNPEGPEGLRANRVGFDLGSTTDVPDISLLTNYFEFGRFRFPFSIASGTQDRSKTYVINFWLPPKDSNDLTMPVKWWLEGSHWHWVFPKGTIIGEVMMIKDPTSNDLFVFEIRVRTRTLNNWKTNIFRPFLNSMDLAARIEMLRPNWMNSDLKGLVEHLQSTNTLAPAKLESTPYKDIFSPMIGSLDKLPGTSDYALIRSLLIDSTFQEALNSTWKTEGSLKTFAPSTDSEFHIVPKNYNGGLFATDEKSCSACHNQTGRPLGHVNRRLVLYGEIWGEDQIFTWHPFEVIPEMYNVSDGSRKPNVKMLRNGLIEQQKPDALDLDYRQLPKPYKTNYDNSDPFSTRRHHE